MIRIRPLKLPCKRNWKAVEGCLACPISCSKSLFCVFACTACGCMYRHVCDPEGTGMDSKASEHEGG